MDIWSVILGVFPIPAGKGEQKENYGSQHHTGPTKVERQVIWLRPVKEPPYNRGSKHDPKSPEEHEDAVGLRQSVQADNLSSNVGGERPVSREETQDDRKDL